MHTHRLFIMMLLFYISDNTFNMKVNEEKESTTAEVIWFYYYYYYYFQHLLNLSYIQIKEHLALGVEQKHPPTAEVTTVGYASHPN